MKVLKSLLLGMCVAFAHARLKLLLCKPMTRVLSGNGRMALLL